MPQCENISTATYYDKPVTYNDEWEDDDLTYSTFVEKAINSLGVNQHKCQRAGVEQPVESCQQFLRFIDDNATTNTVETCGRDELVFDQKIVESSYPQKFEFLCDRFPLRGIFNSMMFGGMLVGSLVIPPLSDKIGRKPAVIISIFITWTAGMINSFTGIIFRQGNLRTSLQVNNKIHLLQIQWFSLQLDESSVGLAE